MKMGKQGPQISHLMFADDLLLCAQVNLDQMHNVMDIILQEFCHMSGQSVSEEKTRIYFSKNVNHHMRRQLSTMSAFSKVNSLGTYLGIPLTGRLLNVGISSFFLTRWLIDCQG